MPTAPKKIRANDRTLSRSSYNSIVSHVSNAKAAGAFGKTPVNRSRTQAVAYMVEDENLANYTIQPFQPCRIIRRKQLENFDSASAAYEVAPLNYSFKDEGVPQFYGYGITGRDGISADEGGEITIAGIGLIQIRRDQAVDGFLEDLSKAYIGGADSFYYVVGDKSICDNTKVRVAPTGHWRIISRLRCDEYLEELDDIEDKLFVVVDMNSQPTTVLVDVETSIAPATYDDPSNTLDATGGTARVLEFSPYEDEYGERSTNRKFKNESKQDFEINVYNDTENAISVGRHKAIWSTEYNCFFFVTSSTGTFQIEMTQVGGEQGTSTDPASWTYDVKVWEGDGSVLKAGVDPVASPSHYRRPNAGQLDKATFGTATYNSAGELVIIDCNETLKFTTC